MGADLVARYGRRFIGSARQRLAAAAELDGAGAAEAARTLALHLHSISGEAAMIGFSALSQRAREAMRAAQALQAGTGTPAGCAAEIAAVRALLDELEQSLP